MEVKVKFYAMLREIAGKKTEQIRLPPKSSVRALINLLVDRYGGDFEKYIYDSDKQVRNYLSYLLNGVNINRTDMFDTILRDGDTFSFLPPVGGG